MEEEIIQSRVIDKLKANGIEAYWENTGGGIMCIAVYGLPEEKYMFWGTADVTWGGDLNSDDGNYIRSFHTDIPSDSDDADALAAAILKAVQEIKKTA